MMDITTLHITHPLGLQLCLRNNITAPPECSPLEEVKAQRSQGLAQGHRQQVSLLVLELLNP